MNIPFYIFAWAASIVYGAEVVIAKILSKHSIANPWMFNFFWSFFTTIILVVLALFGGIKTPTDWTSLLASSFLAAIGSFMFILLLYFLDVTVLSPLYNVRAAFTVVVGIIFLGEAITTRQIGLIALILLASFLVTAEENWTYKSFFNKGILLALIHMTNLAFMSLFVKKSIIANGYWTTLFFNMVISQIVYLFTIPLFKKDLGTLTKKQIGSVFVLGIFAAAGGLAVNKAFETNIGITSVITALPLSMLAAFALSFFAPRLLEKHTLKVYAVRFAAAAVMIVSALNLTR